jgi:hypothetical protein
VYTQGTTFVPAFQIDPMLPVNMKFTLFYPDGRQVIAQGVGDASGAWAGKEPWTLDVPGVYRYTVDGEWNLPAAISRARLTCSCPFTSRKFTECVGASSKIRSKRCCTG